MGLCVYGLIKADQKEFEKDATKHGTSSVRGTNHSQQKMAPFLCLSLASTQCGRAGTDLVGDDVRVDAARGRLLRGRGRGHVLLPLGAVQHAAAVKDPLPVLLPLRLRQELL